MSNIKYTVYKTTNNINGKIYIGCHKTYDVNDSYMGSGNNIKLAIKKYGIENFTKVVLYTFDNSVECYEKEAELVNENFVARQDTYNMHVGGYHGPISKGEDHWAYGKKRPSISKLMTDNNPSTLPHVRKMLSETKVVKLTDSEYGRVALDNTEYENINTGKVTVRDKDGKCFSVYTSDPRFISGELESATKGRFKAKDINGNMFFITKTDPRFISGELVGFMKDVISICPHCSKKGGGGAMKRWHFDNCKHKG